MKTWMLPWLFPVGLLGAVGLVVVSSPYEALTALCLGVLVVPVLWRVHFRPSAGGDDDATYWRTKAL